MALPESTKQFVEKRLDTYCEERIPAHARHQVRLGYKVRGNHVTLYEERPSFLDFEAWVDIKVAQFRFDAEDGKWAKLFSSNAKYPAACYGECLSVSQHPRESSEWTKN